MQTLYNQVSLISYKEALQDNIFTVWQIEIETKQLCYLNRGTLSTLNEIHGCLELSGILVKF